MVANITSAADQLDESISTCRFAQRVAAVACEVRAGCAAPGRAPRARPLTARHARPPSTRSWTPAWSSRACARRSTSCAPSCGAGVPARACGRARPASGRADKHALARCRLARGGEAKAERGALSPWQHEQVRAAVAAYLADPAPDAPPPLGDSLAAARAAFGALRERLAGGAGEGAQRGDRLDQLRAQARARV